MPFVIVGIVIALVRWLWKTLTAVLNENHTIAVQGPDRQPPDPELLPRMMQTKRGLWLHWCKFWPERDIKHKGTVMLVAGYGDHVARYEGLALWLNSKGYGVYMMDNQGHGLSEGDRKYSPRFEYLIDDQEQFLRRVVLADDQVSAKPLFLLGHSLGGLISSHLVLRTSSVWQGVVLSGPAIRVDPKTAPPSTVRAAKFLSKWLPKMPLPGNIAIEDLAHNPDITLPNPQDPAVPKDKMMARMGAESLEYMAKLETKLEQFTRPVLVVHGEDDKICNVSGSRAFIEQVGSIDKKLVVYPKLLHEVLFERKEDRTKVWNEVLRFLDEHLE